MQFNNKEFELSQDGKIMTHKLTGLKYDREGNLIIFKNKIWEIRKRKLETQTRYLVYYKGKKKNHKQISSLEYFIKRYYMENIQLTVELGLSFVSILIDNKDLEERHKAIKDWKASLAKD